MNFFTKNITVIFVLLLICKPAFAQSDSGSELIDYFYPISSEKIVYKYEDNRRDTSFIEYSVFWSIFNADTVLINELYSADYELKVTRKYKVTKKGAFVQELTLHNLDSGLSINDTFRIDKDTFMLFKSDTNSYMTTHNDGLSDVFSKKSIGGYGKYKWRDETINSVVFNELLWRKIDSSKQGVVEIESVYAKGMGLVSESWTSGFTRITERRNLIDILKYRDWQKK